MFKVLALVVSLVDPSADRTFVSAQGYPSLQSCEAALPAAQKSFDEFLAAQYGASVDMFKVSFRCEFEHKV